MSMQTIAARDNTLTRESDEQFPFRTELSLEPLITFWEEAAASDEAVCATMARFVLDQLRAAPELRGAIRDLSVLERQRPLVDALMSVVFPAASWDQDLRAAVVPGGRTFYATPSFARLLTAEAGTLRLSISDDALSSLRQLHAYGLVLRRFYDIEADVEHPVMVTVREPATELDLHFKLSADGSFVRVEAVGSVPELSESARRRLLASPSDLALLRELIPPDRFLLTGFAVYRAVDVTDQEILSALKRDLIERESIIASASFRRLQDRLRAFFRRPRLELGLAAISGEQVFMLNSNYQMEHGCIFADSTHHRTSDYGGSVFERAARTGRPVFIPDLAAYADRTSIEDSLLQKKGMVSLAVAPLNYQDALIGTLTLSSARAGDISAALALKLEEILPLFSMAVKRGMDELNARVEAQIKQHFTAIHPAVEWRFRRAVLRSFEQSAPGGSAEVEPIVFDNVYPLYAATDIRGSSTQRNLAIQTDLATHLGLARDVLRAAYRARDLPILDVLAHRVSRHADVMTYGLRSGDDLSVLTFLRAEVEPVFAQLGNLGADVAARLEAYRSAMDPRLGTVYARRKAFDESVALLNDTIVSYLDAEEARAQAMFPHYFEKQQTDGVDFGIYVGGSLVESGQFDLLYLRNLRLWQLLVICGIARRAEVLKARLPIPLETTHLVLAHHAPLGIRFRVDEKRFDVDGAYNVRYEVVKKRIDKATVKGSGERLTQPGRIAIIYAQPPEAAEYREYIDYLQARRELGQEVEELELDELQGVEGLRALRVAVNLQGAAEVEAPRVDVAERVLANSGGA